MVNDYERFLTKAKQYLEDYTADIPEQILHNIGSTHKVSSGWFQNCGGLFSLAYKKGITDEKYKTRFFDYIEKTGLRNRLRTTKKDIVFVDNLLREFIDELEKKKV